MVSFMQNQPYPSWFFGLKSNFDKPDILIKIINYYYQKLNIKPDDLNYLINKHYDFIKEELLYYKKIEKGN
jgi:hypothetical protein